MQNCHVHATLEGEGGSAHGLKSCTPKYVKSKYMTIFQLKEGVEMEVINIKTGNLQVLTFLAICKTVG